tara:strand:- start:79 stop:672 length:594 start_codon:yes stop_codon:yes gene_type:complete
MFLKNELNLLIYFIIITFVSKTVYSNDNYFNKILKHISNIDYFSASFVQNDGINISEGKVFIGKNRVRAEYFSPDKILIILDEDKAMYYNYELDEDEFFNPKDTHAWVFYDIFRNPFFFEDASIKVNDNELILEKDIIDLEQNKYFIKVFFEHKPITLRRVEFFVNEDFLQLSIFNHNYNETFNEDFFKLINPNFFN